MDRMKNARMGILFGVVNNVLSIVLPFICRTIILYTLGTEYLGLGTLFSSVVNVLNVTELGFGAAVAILLYEPVAKNDTERIRSILNFTKKVFYIIGTVVMLTGFAAMPFLEYLISGDVPDGINIYLLYLAYLANVVCSYYLAAHKRLLFAAYQRYDVETKIASGVLIGQYALQVAVLLLWRNYYLYVAVFPLATICSNLICKFLTKRMYPQCYCSGTIGKEDISVLKKKVAGSFASKLGETMHLAADNVVISAILGLKILGKYTNYYFVIVSLVALFAVIHNTLRPIFGNCVTLDGKTENFRRFRVFHYGYQWLSALCGACLLCLYQDFICIWAGAENLFPDWYVWLFAAYFVSSKLAAPNVVLVEAAGLLWESKHVSLLSAGANLLLNIVGGLLFGLPGILIASILTNLLVNYLGFTRVLFRHYFTATQDRKQYGKDILAFLAEMLICIPVCYFATQWFVAGNLLLWLAKAALTVTVFGGCYLLLNFKNHLFRQTLTKGLQMLCIKKK